MKLFSSPSRRERGTALLVVLLLVATLSVITLSIVTGITKAVRVQAYSGARGQALWFAQGIEDLARARLVQLLGTNEGKLDKRTPGIGETMEFPIPGGLISAKVVDGSNCFNLNSLAQSEEEADTTGVISAKLFYTRLLTTLEIDENQAQSLVAALQDWIDTDTMPRAYGAETTYYASLEEPYAAGDTLLTTPQELLAIKGYTPEIFRHIRSYVCARPTKEIGVFNVNTLTLEDAPLLVPVFSNEITLEQVVNQLEMRGDMAFGSANEFLALQNFALVGEEQKLADLLGIVSSYFYLSGEVVYLDTVTGYEAVFERNDTNGVDLVRRRLGVDE